MTTVRWLGSSRSRPAACSRSIGSALDQHEDNAGNFVGRCVHRARLRGHQSNRRGYRDGVSSGVVEVMIFYAQSAQHCAWAATNLASSPCAGRGPAPVLPGATAVVYDLLRHGRCAEHHRHRRRALVLLRPHRPISGDRDQRGHLWRSCASPDTLRPWIALVAGTALTAFVGVRHVPCMQRFPTDVIAGVMAAAGVGVLVAHLHRDEPTRHTLSIGFSREGDGGTVGPRRTAWELMFGPAGDSTRWPRAVTDWPVVGDGALAAEVGFRAFAALEPCRAEGAGCRSGVDCCCGYCIKPARPQPKGRAAASHSSAPASTRSARPLPTAHPRCSLCQRLLPSWSSIARVRPSRSSGFRAGTSVADQEPTLFASMPFIKATALVLRRPRARIRPMTLGYRARRLEPPPSRARAARCERVPIVRR